MTHPLAYCTNVHYTPDAATLLQNLREFAGPVRNAVDPSQPLGVGLWFSAEVVRQLQDSATLAALHRELEQQQLVPCTYNAFPQHNFHQPVVKHAVYRPDWSQPERLDYTWAVAEIAAKLLPRGSDVSISTLPLGWGPLAPEGAAFARTQLIEFARRAAELERRQGQRIVLCLEPEPGCTLGTVAQAIRWFSQQLYPGPEQERLRRHIQLCFDVCHAAVMFESIEDLFGELAAAAIPLGKVQVSAAVRGGWTAGDVAARTAALAALAAFDEPRYLHQTAARCNPTASLHFWEDLPAARAGLASWEQAEFRTHFHVPIYAETLGPLGTTQDEIGRFLRGVSRYHPALQPRHYEVETYAWTVLPAVYQPPTLVAGIARELRWLMAEDSAAKNAALAENS